MTLHGTAATAAEKAEAEQARARRSKACKEVRNLIEVVPSSVAKAVSAKDEDIEQRVKMALASDKALTGSAITVQSVNDGSVLLAGTAETPLARICARSRPRARSTACAASRARSRARTAWRTRRSGTTPEEQADAAATRVSAAASDAWITSATKVRLMAAEHVSAFDVNVDTRAAS